MIYKSGTRKGYVSLSRGFWVFCVLLVSYLLVNSVLMPAFARSNRTKDLRVNDYPLYERSKIQRYEEKLSVLVKRVATLKGKLRLLTEHGDINIFSSLRPKVGKTYKDEHMESMKSEILRECRSKLLPLSIQEVETDLK